MGVFMCKYVFLYVSVWGAGAQGPGGLEEEFGLWGGHLFPQDQLLQPHLRQERAEAFGL